MAFQRDYVLRMIEMMGEFFRRLGELMDERERLRMLDDACREHCGFSLEAAEALSLETVAELLTPQARLMLSELSYLKAQAVAQAPEESDALRYRALQLLCGLHDEEILCVERAARLRELMDDCASQMTAEDYLRCARFFVAGEHYDDGEDAIFLAVETAEDRPYYILQGVALLRGLLLLPDSALTPGGLPRADVLRAIDDLEAWETT